MIDGETNSSHFLQSLFLRLNMPEPSELLTRREIADNAEASEENPLRSGVLGTRVSERCDIVQYGVHITEATDRLVMCPICTVSIACIVGSPGFAHTRLLGQCRISDFI